LLTIGDNLGGPDADVVRYGPSAAGDQISEFSGAGINLLTVTVNASGLLDLNGKSDTLASSAALTLNIAPGFSAEVRTGTGTLTLGGNLTVGLATGVSVVNTTTATPGAVINGIVDLGAGGTRTITVTDTNAPNDLTINANLVSNATAQPGLIEGVLINT